VTNSGRFQEEGYQMMGAAFEVYNEIGGGLLEEIYQECMELELGFGAIPFRSKNGIAAFYKSKRLRKRYVPDLILFNGLIVELKAVAQLIADHEAQLINYLRLSKRRVGYLLNFGPTNKLEWRRFII
jgi:GxxExxY protein